MWSQEKTWWWNWSRSLHLSVWILKQHQSSSSCPCTTTQPFSDQDTATAPPDTCTASPWNPTEPGTAYDLHNGPESLPCSKLSLITLRARRTLLWGLVGTGLSSQQAPWHMHVTLYIVPWASTHSCITWIWHLPSFQTHKYTLQPSSNPCRLQPRQCQPACLCFLLWQHHH